MSRIYTAARSTILAVVTTGRGADGSLGSDAQTCSIPAGRFRPNVGNAPLADIAEITPQFDRAVELRWPAAGDLPGPRNTLDAKTLRSAMCVLTVGYVYGKGNDGMLLLWPGESAADALRYPDERALADAERVWRAFFPPEIYQGGDPAIVSIQREGDASVQDLGGGRMVCTTHFAVWLELDRSNNYDS